MVCMTLAAVYIRNSIRANKILGSVNTKIIPVIKNIGIFSKSFKCALQQKHIYQHYISLSEVLTINEQQNSLHIPKSNWAANTHYKI